MPISNPEPLTVEPMTEALKERIYEAASAYVEEQKISWVKLADTVRLNKAYMSYFKNRKWEEVPSGDNVISLKDEWFEQLAVFLGIETRHVAYWQHFDNYNFRAVTVAFEEARHNNKQPRLVQGDTGYGKTYCKEQYLKQHLATTSAISLEADMNAKEFMVELAEAVGVNTVGTRAKLRKEIGKKLRQQPGHLLIIDEAENLTDKMIDSLKALWQQIRGYCGLVIMGVDVIELFERGKNRRKKNYPQTYRRFEFNWTLLEAVNGEDIAAICNTYTNVAPSGRNWLKRYMSGKDWDALGKVMDTALREASGSPIGKEQFEALFYYYQTA